MFNNFKYFRRLIMKKEKLSNVNKSYLIAFAEREIKEWQEFIEYVKNNDL